MKGSEFREIRKKFGLKKADWMYALGYAGNKNTLYLRCDRFENGTAEIPLYIARYVWLLGQLREVKEIFGDDHLAPIIDGRGLPDFPDWPGYHLDEEKTV